MTTTPVLDAPREQDPIAAAPAPATALRAWAYVVSVLVARMYRTYLLGLVVIAVAPFLFGWGSYVVESGSMKPSIQVGDVVIAKPFTDDQRIRVGRVFVYDDPGTTRPHLMVHRIVELRDDGDYTTAGDANELTDVTPLARSDVRATAVLLVPFVGVPVTWAQSGRWLPLALWLLLTIATLALAARNLAGEPPKWGLLRLVRGWFSPRTPPDDPSGSTGSTGSGGTSRAGWRHADPAQASGRALRTRVPLLTVAGLVLLSTLASTASAGFTGQTRNSGWSWAVGPWTQPYVAAVLADQPYGLWLLDETAGSAYGADRSGNNRTAQYYDSLTLARPGGLTNNPGTAVRTSGGRVVLGPQAVVAPPAYSIELWFRTTATSQSYLAGFEDDRDAGFSFFGTDADRAVTMDNGRLTFGRWPWSSQTITTPRSYNDGAWHHLVVTSTSTRFTTIYVDGVPAVSGTTSAVGTYTGFWRVGQGSIGFLNTPAFNGEIDNVSIFHSVLTSARVAAHWTAR